MTGRWFQPYAPSPQVESLLACRWTAAGTGQHLLVPDGSMDVVWRQDGSLVLCGPDTTSWIVDMGAGSSCVGIRFHPGAAAAAFRCDADQLVDRRVPLDDLIGARATRIIGERIADAPDLTAKMRELERLVTVGPLHPKLASTHGQADHQVQTAVRTLTWCDRRVEQLAEQTDLSPRQLQRRFVRHVGYPPSQYVRIARLQRFLHRSAADDRASLAELAAVSGYADQSHLARDCRSIAGVTPSQMRASVAATSHASPRLPQARDVRSVQDPMPDDRSDSAA